MVISSLSVLSFVLLLHPVHISVTEVEYSEKHNAVQIVSRIFTDDLELSIQNALHNPNIDLTDPHDDFDGKKLVGDYLAQHIHISIDHQPRDVIFLGYEEDGVVLKCYLEIEHADPFERIEITNSVITETYEDQSNMVHITYQKELRSARLTKDHPSKIFTF